MSQRLDPPSPAEVAQFDERGYLVVEDVLPRARVEALRERFPRLFRGEFETGSYPDEWHWREGISYPDATRHMSNAWKADRTLARWVLSPEPARFAALLSGWDAIRVVVDTLWWKTPRAKPIMLHQDTSFIDCLEPRQSVTCWLALDDTRADAGTIEYVPGSHRWAVAERHPEEFHTPGGGHRAQMLAAAAAAGVADPEVVPIEVRAGSLVFHHGEIWHGSGANARGDVERRSIGIHMVPGGAVFAGCAGGYILGRYRRAGERELDESHFPLLWSRSGARTAFLESYCETGRLP